MFNCGAHGFNVKSDMLSNTSNRSESNKTKTLKKRQESAERQNQARDEVLDDH